MVTRDFEQPRDREVREILTEWAAAAGAETTARERAAWLVVVASLVADVLLTRVGLQAGLVEGNPLVRRAIDATDIGALVSVKLLVLGIALLVRARLPRHGQAVPSGWRYRGPRRRSTPRSSPDRPARRPSLPRNERRQRRP